MHNILQVEMIAPLEDFGCFVTVIDGTLFACAMRLDGTPDTDGDDRINWAEVVAPDDQAFLDQVKAHFVTDFQLHHFAGR